MKIHDCAATVIVGKLTKILDPEQEMLTQEALHYADVHISELLESRGIPDPYYFRFDDAGRLVSFNKNEPIENVVLRRTPLEKVEYEALKKIQEESFKRDSGFILWISPPHPDYYPMGKTAKIVISEIVEEQGEKMLLNRAIVTDWDNVGSILAANELASLSDMDPFLFKNLTEIRRNPIFLKKDMEDELIRVLENILDKNSLEMMLSGTDFQEKERLMRDYLQTGTMAPLGNKPRSCPTLSKQTAFQVFSGEKRVLCCTCPFCGEQVEAEIYDGKIHCPECKEEAPFAG